MDTTTLLNLRPGECFEANGLRGVLTGKDAIDEVVTYIYFHDRWESVTSTWEQVKSTQVKSLGMLDLSKL